MNELSRRLMGVVSEFPRQSVVLEQDHVCVELREVLAENDRLIQRNKELQSRLKTALKDVAQLDQLHRLNLRVKNLQRRLSEVLDRNAELEHGAGHRVRLDELAAGPKRPGLALGALRLNYEMRALQLDGRSVQLTPRGLKLMDYLMRWPERVVQIAELAEVLEVDDPGGSAVRTLVWRVRQQLSEIGALPYLRTYGRTWSGGTGYWMSDPERGGQS